MGFFSSIKNALSKTKDNLCEVESSSIILSNLTINGTMYVQNVGTSDNTYTVSLNSVDINGTQNSTVIDCGNINYLTFEINECNIVGNYNSSSYSRNVFEADQRDNSTWTNDVVLIVRDSKISMIKDNTASTREFALFDLDGGSYYGLIWSEVQMLGNTILEDICIGSSVPAEYAMKSDLWYPDEDTEYLLVRDATVQLVGQVGFRMQESRLDGAGTEEDPYIVAFFDDLSLINNSVSGFKDMAGYHKQVRDIDCGGSSVTRLFCYDSGKESNYFVGTYDGGGFSIYDYKYSSSLNSSSSYNSLGLIPVLGVGGTVKNVNLVANDTDTYYFAPNREDAQYVGTIVGTCYGSVENCSSNMNIVFGANAATSTAGGIIGCLESTGSYSDITYTGTITYTDGTTSTDPIGVAVNEGN